MSSIPASQLVGTTSGVINTGGSALSLNAVFLSQDPALVTGKATPFSNPTSVGNFFGLQSTEYDLAKNYFNGFNGSSIKPSVLYFSKYNASPAAAFLRSASLVDVSLAQLKAISGTLALTVNGVGTTSNINLTAATSFANAASLIQTATSVDCTYDAQRNGFVFDVGTGTIAFATGTAAAALRLTEASGAVVSAAAGISTPDGVMNGIVSQTQNFASYMTVFEPDEDTKLAFAAWNSAQGSRYVYVVVDTSSAGKQASNAASLGAIIKLREYDGVVTVYNDFNVAAFVCGAIASINFKETNGRTTLAYKGQSGLEPTITDVEDANGLLSNGYNFYGNYATSTDVFNLFQKGSISGVFKWVDSYINQIRLTNQLQLAIISLLVSVKALAYNEKGYGLTRSACQAPIKEMVNFGGIQTGINLSDAQKAEVNSKAGADIANTLITQGYYLQIKDADAQTRGERKSPPMTLFYTDGGSIQQLNLASINVQ